MGIWSKFNKTVDTEGMKKDIEDVQKNGGGFEALPNGEYEVKVEKMEQKETKKGDPMLTIRFKVIAGDKKGRLMFANYVLSSAFGTSRSIDMLNSLDSGTDVYFDDYDQYGDLIEEVYNAVSDAGLEYVIEQTEDDKGFTNFEIKEVFDGK